MIDLLYVSHNRLAFTQATLPALIANTNFDLVAKLQVLDDQSTDGTAEFLVSEVAQFYTAVGMNADYTSDRFGGPVAAMNYAVDHAETDVLVKVDNDLLLCPGWLDALLEVLASAPDVDVLGFEAGFGGGPAPADADRTHRAASHVGGIGAFRTRIFRNKRPVANGVGGRFGWTEFQRRHASCAWLVPDLPCPLLDHLPFEPWRTLTAEYVGRGWSRSWEAYPGSMRAYWDWAFERTTA